MNNTFSTIFTSFFAGQSTQGLSSADAAAASAEFVLLDRSSPGSVRNRPIFRRVRSHDGEAPFVLANV